MQDLVGGGNNRTSVIFQAPDNLVFVGEVTDFGGRNFRAFTLKIMAEDTLTIEDG